MVNHNDHEKIVLLIERKKKQLASSYSYLVTSPYLLVDNTAKEISWSYPYGRSNSLAHFYITCQNDPENARDGRRAYALRFGFHEISILQLDRAEAVVKVLRTIERRLSQSPCPTTYAELVTAVGKALRIYAFAIWQEEEPELDNEGPVLLLDADGARAWIDNQECAYIMAHGGVIKLPVSGARTRL
jgi:hypothetical protein